MFESLQPFIELGSTTIIAIGLIYVILQITKIKRNSNNGLNEEILAELQKTNTNHLDHIKECMDRNNDQLVNCIHQDNLRIIELLGRIDGKLK